MLGVVVLCHLSQAHMSKRKHVSIICLGGPSLIFSSEGRRHIILCVFIRIFFMYQHVFTYAQKLFLDDFNELDSPLQNVMIFVLIDFTPVCHSTIGESFGYVFSISI